MKKLRVLYVAESEEQFNVFSSKVERVLHSRSIYTTVVREDYQSSKVENYIRENRPQLCFIDIFAESEMAEGDQRSTPSEVVEVSKKFPEVLFFGLTRGAVDVARLGVGFPATMTLLSKYHLDHSESPDQEKKVYTEYLSQRIERELRRCSISNIKVVDKRERPVVFRKSDNQGHTRIHTNFDPEKRQNNILRDLCRILNLKESSKSFELMQTELFALVEGVTVDGSEAYHIPEVELELLSGGYSGAVVLAVRLMSESVDRKMDVPGVIKISKRQEAMKEFSNYQDHVKWTLPYTWRVDVLGHCETAKLGAVCYSFVMSGSATPVPVTDELRLGNGDVVQLAVQKVFNPDSQTWYSTKKNSGRKLEDYYFQKPFFRNIEEIWQYQDALIEILEECGVSVDRLENRYRLTVGRKRFEVEKLEVLKTRDFGPLEECISHGDMNANNMIVDDKAKTIAFIDFEKTGFWHVYRDFVSFESSIRLDMNSLKRIKPNGVATFADRFKWEQQLVTARFEGLNRKTVPEYIRQISLVRQVASENHGRGFNEYLLGALVHHWWLLVRFKDRLWDEKQIERLASMVLASWIELMTDKKS